MSTSDNKRNNKLSRQFAAMHTATKVLNDRFGRGKLQQPVNFILQPGRNMYLKKAQVYFHYPKYLS